MSFEMHVDTIKYGDEISEKQAYNVNTVEDFFLILNRLKKQKN